jgi:hypothetical protein
MRQKCIFNAHQPFNPRNIVVVDGAVGTIVEKLAFFSNQASGGTSQALQLHCIVGYKIAVTKVKVIPYLGAWVRAPRRTWNTA